MTFTSKELAEMAAADAEIERSFRITSEERRRSRALDAAGRIDALIGTDRHRSAAAQKEYREANREKIAAAQKEYYEANREKIAAAQKEYREANREKYNTYMREYMAARRGERRKADGYTKNCAAEGDLLPLRRSAPQGAAEILS